MKKDRSQKEIKVKIVQKTGEEPISAEIIAQSIKKISDSIDQISKSGLSGRAVRVLLRDASGESMTSIVNVLDGLKELRRLYLKD